MEKNKYKYLVIYKISTIWHSAYFTNLVELSKFTDNEQIEEWHIEEVISNEQ